MTAMYHANQQPIGYQQIPQSSQDMYRDHPQMGNGTQGPIPAPVAQILSLEPPELGHMMASPKAAPPPYPQTYPHAAPGFAQQSVPLPNMPAVLPNSQPRMEPTSQDLDIYQHRMAPTSHIDSRLAAQTSLASPHQFPSSQADLALPDTYFVPASSAATAQSALTPYYFTGSAVPNLDPRQQHNVPTKHEIHQGHAALMTLGYPKKSPSYTFPVYPGLPSTLEPAHPAVVATAPPAGRVDVVPYKHKPLPTRRGPFKDTAAREKTAQTRKMGSCIRCKMQRIRVSWTRCH
jgi:hypothetical protein